MRFQLYHFVCWNILAKTKRPEVASTFQKGIAALEMALILPLLAIFTFSIYDTGMALLTYMELEQSTKEIARYLASQENLEQGSFLAKYDTDSWIIYKTELQVNPNNGLKTTIQSNCGGTLTHCNVLSTLGKVFESQIPDGPHALTLAVDLKGSEIESAFNKDAKTVTVKLSSKYSGLFVPFNGMPIRTKVVAPYL